MDPPRGLSRGSSCCPSGLEWLYKDNTRPAELEVWDRPGWWAPASVFFRGTRGCSMQFGVQDLRCSRFEVKAL